MKIIIKRDTQPGLSAIVDSAIARDGLPWFIPDFGADWTFTLALAMRISRLGKSISPRFAPRYTDAISLLFIPACTHPGSEEILSLMDSSAVCGQWQPIPVDTADLTINDTHIGTLASYDFPQFMALASHYATLKTGDILAIPIAAIAPTEIQRNFPVKFTLNNRPTLSFNIK